MSTASPEAPPIAVSPRPAITTRTIRRQSLFTRVWHWVNAACLLILLMSGLQIFNAHPALYWGDQSNFAAPALAIGAQPGADGQPEGVVRVFGHALNTTGVLGLSYDNGQPQMRAFPSWLTLPGPQWLAMGRQWHFAAAWIFAPMVIAYLIYTLASPKQRRRIWPTASQWRALPRTIAHHARLRFEHTADYNGLQKLTYLLVLFGLLPLIIATGLTMSPTIDAAWPWLPELFGGRQSARTIHFICAFSLVAFFIVHLAMVLVSGVLNNMRSIITGRYRIEHGAPAQDTDHE